MTTSTQDHKRLLDALLTGSNPKNSLRYEYDVKLSQINFNSEEVDFICDALSHDKPKLAEMILSAIWDIDRNAIHTFIYMFDFCNVIMTHEINPDPKASYTLKNIYERVTTDHWKKAGAKGPMSEDLYRSVALQVEAEYLKKSLYLESKEPAFTDLEMMNSINGRLIEHEAVIRRHLKLVLDYWLAMRRGQGYFITEQVIELCELMDEFPGSDELVLAFANERHYYDEGALRQCLSIAAPALSEGAI